MFIVYLFISSVHFYKYNAISDEIAQCTHDLEDGIRSNIISFKQIEDMDLVKEVINKYEIQKDNLFFTVDIRNNLIRLMVDYLIKDVFLTSKRKLEKFSEDSIPLYTNENDVYKEKIIDFSSVTAKMVKQLSENITKLLVMSQSISQSDSKAEYIVSQLFKAYYTNPQQLPDYILERYFKKRGMHVNRLELDKQVIELRKDADFIRCIVDHIACMTDQFVEREYNKLYTPGYFTL